MRISFPWPTATEEFRRGDLVVFRKEKHSAHPGPRARYVAPEPNGEGYSYLVDKYWVVVGPAAEGKVLLRTRRGKEHLVRAGDPRLRRAHWWERLLHRLRFPQLPDASAA